MDLDALIPFEMREDTAYRRMLDLRNPINGLLLPINEAVLVVEERRQPAAADVSVLIDRGGENRTGVLAVPLRVIAPPTEERDPERGAADDHDDRIENQSLSEA